MYDIIYIYIYISVVVLVNSYMNFQLWEILQRHKEIHQFESRYHTSRLGVTKLHMITSSDAELKQVWPHVLQIETSPHEIDIITTFYIIINLYAKFR